VTDWWYGALFVGLRSVRFLPLDLHEVRLLKKNGKPETKQQLARRTVETATVQ